MLAFAELIDWLSTFAEGEPLSYMNNWHNKAAFMKVLVNVFDTWQYRLGKQTQVVAVVPVHKCQSTFVGRRSLVVVDTVDKLSRIRDDNRSQWLVQVDVYDVFGKFPPAVKEDVKT